MNKKLVLILSLVLASTTVFATKARLESLGEDRDGSFFIEDGRNVFLNAASINNVKDSMTLEWGRTQNGDSATKSAAEGGFFKSYQEFTYGVFYGRQDASVSGDRGNPFAKDENTIDLLFGGEMDGIKWGTALSFSSHQNDADATVTPNQTNISQSALALRFGVSCEKTEVFGRLSLMNNAEFTDGTNGTSEYDGKLGATLGVTHKLGHGYKAFAQYTQSAGEFELNNVMTQDFDFKRYVLGYGKTTKLNDMSTMFTKVQYLQQEKDQLTVGDTEFKNLTVNMGLETQVKRYLTLRASVSQSLWSENTTTANVTDSNGESTRVNGGLSVHLKEFTIDASATKAGNNTVGRVGITYDL